MFVFPNFFYGRNSVVFIEEGKLLFCAFFIMFYIFHERNLQTQQQTFPRRIMTKGAKIRKKKLS